MTTNKFRIELVSKKSPATFVAYDILFYDKKQVTDLPLVERKRLLQKVVGIENESYPFDKYRNDETIWISPDLVCTVKYMEKTSNGEMRQPIYKGLRWDKAAGECLIIN